MNVAVPLPKHSAMFGHDASSQTVCRFCLRRMSLISWKRELGLAARTRIHAGLGSVVARGTMRIVLLFPFSFTPASRIFEMTRHAGGKLVTHGRRCIGEAQVFGLRDSQTTKPTGVDERKGLEIHVDVERHPMVRPTFDDADTERGDLGFVHVNARRAGATLCLVADEIDDRLLEQVNEGLYLDTTAREIDQ